VTSLGALPIVVVAFVLIGGLVLVRVLVVLTCIVVMAFMFFGGLIFVRVPVLLVCPVVVTFVAVVDIGAGGEH